MAEVPPGMVGPLEVALATSTEAIPKDPGLAFEPKWDGYRATLTRTGSGVTRIWSRRGNDLTDRFPDVAAAAARQLPAGVVLDGVI
jgi:ATP-dependent DNA ligase